MTKYQMKVARATSEEIQHLYNLLIEMQYLSDHFRTGGDVETIDWEDYEILGRHKATDASELLKTISHLLEATRWEIMLINLQTLLDNVADPDIPHLDFNPEIKRAFEALQTKQTINQQNIGNMKELLPTTVQLIENELHAIPEKYQKNFNSTHEGYAVLLEEVRELEAEVFFGEKRDPENHKNRLREEAVQIAAMAIRFIQELTD